MQLAEYIRNIPDYPKPGIQFKDVTSLLANPEAFQYSIRIFKERYENQNIDIIAGIESRGFIFGSALAFALGISFVPIRKKGKLPGETISQSYQLEYGTDEIEVHQDAIQKNQNIVIIDDLMATGGTMEAAILLTQKLHANIVETCCLIDLPDLGGSNKMKKLNIPFYTQLSFEGH